MSVFDWNTGHPSIFGGMQSAAHSAAGASAALSKRLGTEPKKIKRDPAPHLKREKVAKPPKVKVENYATKPLSERIDMELARAYRMTGATWKQCAEKFGCTAKSIRIRLNQAYPEVAHSVPSNGGGMRAKVLPMVAIIAEINGGAGLKETARKYGIAHTTLTYRLHQIAEGKQAVRAAQERAILRNNSGHPFGSVHIPTRAETDRTNSIRGR